MLFSQEFQSLKDSNQICGDVIDALSVLSNSWENSTFIPTQLATCILAAGMTLHREEPSTAVVSILNRLAKFRGKIFMPYCDSNHWMAVVIDNILQTVMHVNPYGNLHEPWRCIHAYQKSSCFWIRRKYT